VSLAWNPGTPSVFGYYVYRTTNQDGSYSRLNPIPITTTQYTDVTVQPGQTYLYWVTSVDSDTIESLFSNSVLATIPTP
jgi:fibronectin type 3 domain-containing protein